MPAEPIIINPKDVLCYAGDSPKVLNALIGRTLRHSIFGWGRIKAIEQGYINVVFDQPTNGIRARTFTKAAFYDGKFPEVSIPISLFREI